MNDFYEIQFPQKKGEIFLESFLGYDEKKLKTGEYKPKGVFNVKISEGTKFYDILRFQDPFNFAISEKVLNILKQNSISGWREFEINIAGCDYKYYGFQVFGKSGMLIRPKKKGFIIGFNFDINTWDHSDFFCPRETLTIFCTKKVLDLFIANKITNIEFIELNKAEWFNSSIN